MNKKDILLNRKVKDFLEDNKCLLEGQLFINCLRAPNIEKISNVFIAISYVEFNATNRISGASFEVRIYFNELVVLLKDNNIIIKGV